MTTRIRMCSKKKNDISYSYSSFVSVCLTFRNTFSNKTKKNLILDIRKKQMGATPSIPESVNVEEITNNTGK